jgi:hypothetical protein
MSLENELKRNTEAIIELTNALTANNSKKGTVPAASPKPAQASPAVSAPTPDVFDDTPTAAAPAKAAKPAVAAEANVGTEHVPLIDKKQIINGVIALAKKRGRDVATKMMSEFGYAKASEFNDAAQYPAVMAKIDELSA